MSNHPMCLDCVAVSVCAAKYGQPICIEVHSKVMKFGKLIANSDSREDSKNSPAAPVQQTKVANCHIWEAGKQCEFVTGWECLDQCCAIPPISNRL